MSKILNSTEAGSKGPLQTLRDLRIADLELLLTAARLKNLGLAAKFHHRSQSAASTAIQRVEAAFGIRLCEHERRHFRLTKEGKLLVQRAETWMKDLSSIVLQQTNPPIRMVMNHAIARVYVPPLLQYEALELKFMRPNRSYEALMHDEADLALVLDNASWKGVAALEVSRGCFQLYSKQKDAPIGPVLLPEDQIEGLTLQQRWYEAHGTQLPIKARLPSWSLIADICMSSTEIGFLPEFLGQKFNLYPVAWQPPPSRYRLLALYHPGNHSLHKRIKSIVDLWKKPQSKRSLS